MHPVPSRFVRALSLFFLLALLLPGCGGSPPTGPPKPKPKPCMPGELTRDDGTCQPAGLPPDMPCPPGELAREDGTCQPAGLPPDMPCPPGELALEDGTCQPAGVPPSACGKGFMPDGKQGCEPILPAAPCPAGQMAIPGETACHEVAFCGHGTWGSIPVDADTQFVDQAYAGGGSDGTKAKPWTTIQQGIDAAKQGATIAVAAGKYAEDLLIQAKAVRLSGRCPALVEVTGKTAAILVLDQAAGGTEIWDLAVTGMGVGIGVEGASSVAFSRVWVHDTATSGLEVADGSSPTGVSLHGSLFEHAHGIGVFVEGADVAIEATVVRDTLTDANGIFGRGINIQDNFSTKVRANVTVRACVIEQNHEVGLLVRGADATIEATVVRGTLPYANGDYGFGVVIQVDAISQARANVTMKACLVEQNHAIGVDVEGADATLSATVIRDTLPAGNGDLGRGVDIQVDALSQARANVTMEACLVEHNRELGVIVSDSEATLSATVVRDTLPDTSGHFGRGVVIQDEDPSTARATATLRACVVEQSHDSGVIVLGADAALSATVVRSTLPDANGNGGIGIEITDSTTTTGANVTMEACLVEQNQLVGVFALRSDVSVLASVIAENHDSGAFLLAANATIEATVLSDTLPDAALAFGRGLDIEADTSKGLRSNVTARACVIEGNQELGVLVQGSDATIEATAIRANTPDEQAKSGLGIAIEDSPDATERANTTLRACLIEQNRYIGVFVLGADATIETTVVKGTLPDAQGNEGRGIFIQIDPDTGARSSATVRACLVEQNHVTGVMVHTSDATIEATTVQGTQPDGDSRFGDGLIAYLSTLTVEDTKITSNARSGVANFGSAIVITSSALVCNAFDLEGEPQPEADFSFDGSTGWACSLRGDADCEKVSTCHVETAGIEAPSLALPPIDGLPPPDQMKP